MNSNREIQHKRARKIMKDNSGGAFVSFFIGIVVLTMLLASAFVIIPIFNTKSRMDVMAADILKAAEISGCTEIAEAISEEEDKIGLKVEADWTGTEYMNEVLRTVQLNSPIKLKLTTDYEMGIPGMTSLSVPVSSHIIGKSEYYFRSATEVSTLPTASTGVVLTIYYKYEEKTGTPAADPVRLTLNENDTYSVNSPTVIGAHLMDSSQAVVEGKAGNSPITVYVLYSAESYGVTVRYINKDTKAELRESVHDSAVYNSEYYVTKPEIEGYTCATSEVAYRIKGTTTITIEYMPKKYNVIINCLLKDGGDETVRSAIVQTYSYGTEETIEPPEVDGYKIASSPVTITITGEKSIDFYYTVKPASAMLTIHYRISGEASDYISGGKSTTYTHEYEIGTEYTVESIDIPGYTPGQKYVNGTMGSEDVEVTVIYVKADFTITVNYYYNETSEKIATTQTVTKKYQEAYSITSPSIPGYTPDKDFVSGTIGTENEEFVVYYTKLPLKGIKVTTDPAKMEYFRGDYFEPADMIVMGYFGNGTTISEADDYKEQIDLDNLTISNMAGTGTPLSPISGSNATITITYEEAGKSASTTLKVTVNEKLKSISVTTAPNKTSYITGENFDSTGMQITASYYNVSTQKVVSGWSIVDGENLPKGQTSVTISYTENNRTATCNQTISVVSEKNFGSLSAVLSGAPPSSGNFSDTVNSSSIDVRGYNTLTLNASTDAGIYYWTGSGSCGVNSRSIYLVRGDGTTVSLSSGSNTIIQWQIQRDKHYRKMM